MTDVLLGSTLASSAATRRWRQLRIKTAPINSRQPLHSTRRRRTLVVHIIIIAHWRRFIIQSQSGPLFPSPPPPGMLLLVFFLYFIFLIFRYEPTLPPPEVFHSLAHSIVRLFRAFFFILLPNFFFECLDGKMERRAPLSDVPSIYGRRVCLFFRFRPQFFFSFFLGGRRKTTEIAPKKSFFSFYLLIFEKKGER